MGKVDKKAAARKAKAAEAKAGAEAPWSGAYVHFPHVSCAVANLTSF